MISFLMIGMALFAQTSITLTFTGRDQHNAHVRLDTVTIQNLTRGWTEAIFFPDTVYTLTVGTGIEDYAQGNEMQVMPNPFNGKTQLNLYSVKGEPARMVIVDITGKKCAEYQGNLSQGDNYFEISLTTPQTYVLSVQTSDGVHSVKMVNTGHAGTNQISLVGGERNVTKVKISSSKSHIFELGDEMRYTGYSQQSNGLIPSAPITQQQSESEVITLSFEFEEAQVSIIGDTAVIFGQSATLTAFGCDTYLWSTGDTTATITVTPNRTTLYTVIGTIHDGYSSDSATHTVVVYPILPIVTTTTVNDISSTTAMCGGNISSDGGADITARGVCWATSTNPTVADSHTTDGIDAGSFTSSLTGLAANTTYYVRAYATNSAGTAYGDEVSFTTMNSGTTSDIQPCPEAATVTDIDNNIYNTVQIGNQCWMKENLRTTRYSDGTGIALGSSTSTTTPYRYYPHNDSSNVSTYGYLYNWKAVMGSSSSSSANPSGVQGICPTGWHVPSDAEWTQLTDYVRSQSQYGCGGDSANIAKSLASTTGWNSSTNACAVGNNPGANNATGFSAFPAGHYNGNYSNVGGQANFWSSTGYSGFAWIRSLYYYDASVYRIYDDKDDGFSVRCVRDSSGGGAASLSTVTTNAVSSITATSATCGGNVTSDGGDAVTARGVCWSDLPNPTVNNSHTIDGSGTGVFTSNLTELSANTTYHVRSYATNSAGTAYGSEVTFTTMNSGSTPDGQPCPEAATVTDIDNNTYNTVQIGIQCWMKENLRTTHYSDGTGIAMGSSTSTTTAYRYYPDNNSANVSTYGYLYNWPAVMHGASSSSVNPSGVQGICPTGWHVPSDAEWTQLTDHVSGQNHYVCGGDSTKIAKSLASTTGWSSSTATCAVGNNPGANNATGFSAFPAGSYDGIYDLFGYDALFWSSTEFDSDYAWIRYLYYGDASVDRDNNVKSIGFSVRCVRDNGGTVSLPTVTTNAVSSITATTATCGGDVTSDGGAAVTARGVCWSDLPNPTVSNSYTTDGIGMGIFSSSLMGLSSNTTYYVRAYATNSAGTAYGSEVSFTTETGSSTGQSCPGTPTVTDYDGNTYNTVQIGNQCWMKENLRTTRYSDGTGIALGSSTSTTTPYRYYPNNDSSNVSTYGYLYNWPAVMHGASSSSANPSGVQGICPTGWHVPSDAEWTQLTDHVSGQNQYVCGGNSANIAMALASTTGWGYSSNACEVGYNPGANNATGFSAFPAGVYSGYYVSFGVDACFWSSTEYDSDYAWIRYLECYDAGVYGFIDYKYGGFSVRCVRDSSGGGTVSLPTVTTNAVSSITATTATCGGDVTSDGGDTVTARGVCWSDLPYPTVSNSHTTDGIGTGIFTSSLTGLVANTTYYVRAYATNSAGTAYGSEVSFTTQTGSSSGQSCPGTSTVTDYDGNTYNTVQIGTQCWMKENLRTTRYSDGTGIALGSSSFSTTTAYRYYPDNDSANVSTYGYLYNWPAVMHGASSSSAAPSGVQGICPTGWHVPSDAEWTQLTDYVSGQSLYGCGGASTKIAKSLASTTGWGYSNDACTVGNNPDANNATGFSAFSAGFYDRDYEYLGRYTRFWSSTENNSGYAWWWGLYYGGAYVNRDIIFKYYGFSVRCVRD